MVNRGKDGWNKGMLQKKKRLPLVRVVRKKRHFNNLMLRLSSRKICLILST